MLAAVVCGLIATGLMLSGGASSAPSTKYYSAVVTPTGASAGASAAFTVTIRNCGKGSPAPCAANRVSTQSLGSANVRFPAGFVLGAVGTPTASGGKQWTATAVGNVVQLRNPGPSNSNALAPGETLSVTVSATAPSSCGSYTLGTQTKQSNDFSGTGNDFTNAGSDPSVLVGSGPLDHFVWTTEPGTSQRAGTSFGATITAYDSCGHVKTNYAGTTASISGLGTSPDNTEPSYDVSWSNGVGTATFTDYKAEQSVRLTVTDGSVSATSSSFDVAPGPLDSFVWAPEPPPSVTAGVSFGATVTAYDHWGNQKTDLDPLGPSFSGLGTSPNGNAPSYGIAWSSGVGTGTFVDFKAEENARITISDGSVSAATTSFDVVPGPLGAFAWTTEPGASQTAGTAFGAAVTASDSWGNPLTAYSGSSFSLGGLHSSPNGSGPDYGSVSWSNGVGTISGVTDDDAETTQLVASDGSVQSPSTSFTVSPAALHSLTWTTQPTETEKQHTISPSPAVKATDQYGNPIAGAAVSVALQQFAGTGTFTPSSTLTATTNGSGIAVFDNLAVTDPGEYALVASSGTVDGTSNGFVVANQLSPCLAGSCSASGSVTNNTKTDASATGAPDGSTLGVSVILGTTPPANVCGTSFTPLGAGSIVNIVGSGGVAPNFTITWTLDKSIVNQIPNNGASQFDICLGAEDLTHPDGTGATPWTTKDGTAAVPVFDPILNATLFWGVLPNCPNQGSPTGPCVLSRHKDKAGDEIVTFEKPSPWDGSYWGGG